MSADGLRTVFDASAVGLRRGVVLLAEADPSWAGLYESLRVALERILPAAVAIEHVGSTSVPGLAAKPVIDVALGLRAEEDERPVAAALEAAGFLFRGEIDEKRLDRLYGLELEPLIRVANLHLVAFEGPTWSAYLRFREALRSSAASREAYGALKQHLASTFPGDRPAYLRGKEAFIASVLAGTLAAEPCRADPPGGGT